MLLHSPCRLWLPAVGWVANRLFNDGEVVWDWTKQESHVSPNKPLVPLCALKAESDLLYPRHLFDSRCDPVRPLMPPSSVLLRLGLVRHGSQ